MERTLIFLVRHGEVENPARIRYGRLPGFGLSERGRRQAAETADYIAARGVELTEVVSSPLQRAIETAVAVSGRLALPSRTDHRVTEADSRFEGLPLDAPKAPRNWRLLMNPVRPSWGEPFSDVGNRMAGAIYDLARAHRGKGAIIVSHQSPIWMARLTLSGFRMPPWLAGPVKCHHASVSTLWFEGLRFVTWWYWRPAG
jgi:broad specificity phosphatase PhoE